MTFDAYWSRLGRKDFDSESYRLAREAWDASDRSTREACAEIVRVIASDAGQVIRAGIVINRYQKNNAR